MVTHRQARRLMELSGREGSLASPGAKAGMDKKTDRKYRRLGKPPSEVRIEHKWQTQTGPFYEIREALEKFLEIIHNSGLVGQNFV